MWYRRKVPAQIRPAGIGGHATGPEQKPVRQIGSEPTGYDPYDSTPAGSPPATVPSQRDGARYRTVGDGDPYGTADRRRPDRSWDNAFIDTWVEHTREDPPRRR